MLTRERSEKNRFSRYLLIAVLALILSVGGGGFAFSHEYEEYDVYRLIDSVFDRYDYFDDYEYYENYPLTFGYHDHDKDSY